MSWPLTGVALSKYNRLLSDLKQYGDFPFVGSPDDITWLQEVIVAASDGALRPPLDDVANRSHFWMLELSRVLGEKVVVCPDCPDCPDCPECPPAVPCPPCPPGYQFTTTPSGMEDEFGIFSFVNLPGLTDVVMNSPSIGRGADIRAQTNLVSFSAPDLVVLDNGVLIKITTSPALTGFSLPALTTVGNSAFIEVRNNSGLTSFSLPALTTVDNSSSIVVSNNSALTSFSLPALTTVDNGSFIEGSGNSVTTSFNLSALAAVDNGSYIEVSNATALTSFSLPALTTVANGSYLQVSDSPALAAISLGSVVFGSGTNYLFSGNALTDVSVNHVLARGVANAGYVSGTIDTSGGTSSAPTGQGIADKATLIARGVTVNTN